MKCRIVIEADIPEEEIIGLKEQLAEQIGDIKVVEVIKMDCLTCKHFIYCSLDKQAFHKITGRQCDEYVGG